MSAMQCLVIMPFQSRFDPIYQAVQSTVVSAVPGRSMDCYWLKDVHAAGRITDDILSGIQKATLCVADLTENNPNVMWETGYAMALGKPTVLISQDIASLPFDLKVHRVLTYDPVNLEALKPTLAKAIAQTLARYDVPASGQTEPPRTSTTSVIAVTGTSIADPARARRRVETLLTPHLSSQPLWYCGTIGSVDEAVLQFLLEHKQRVVAVGYHRLDYSANVLQLIREGKLTFLDASVEAIPRGMTGPSERDIFFASRSDLVILFWDGISSNTRQLIQFFQDNRNNLLVGYV